MDAGTLRLIRDAVNIAIQQVVSRIEAPTMRPGVIATINGPISGTVLLDGDTFPIDVQILIDSVSVGTRVMVMFLPPQGSFAMKRITPLPSGSVYTETTMDTTWTGVNDPTCRYKKDAEGMVHASYRWTLSATPGGGDLIVNLPYPSKYGDFPVGNVRLRGMSFGPGATFNGAARTGGGAVSWFVEDTSGNRLSSVNATSGDHLDALIVYEAA